MQEGVSGRESCVFEQAEERSICVDEVVGVQAHST